MVKMPNADYGLFRAYKEVKMKKGIKTAAFLLLTITVAAGCGHSSKSAETDPNSVPEDTLSVSEDTIYLGNDNIGADESMTESEKIATAGDTESTKGNISEELPDYLKGDSHGKSTESDGQETPAAADVAEGLNIQAGDQITAADNAESCTLGTTYTIHTNSGDVDLTVNSVDIVKNTDPHSSAPKIARVNFTYTNTGCEHGMLFGEIFFRMADDEGKALSVYIPDYTLPDNPEPQVVEKGETCEALIAFEVYDDSDEMTLFFDDQTTGVVKAQQLFWVIR